MARPSGRDVKFKVSSAAFDRLARAASERGLTAHDYARQLLLAALDGDVAQRMTDSAAWTVWALLVGLKAMNETDAARFIASQLEGRK
jgi:hypothetical protein